VVCNGSSVATYSGGNAVNFTGGTNLMTLGGNW